MKIYKRHIEKDIERFLFKGKIVILYGPRQVGKTTFVKTLVEKYNGAYFLCEEADVSNALTNKTSADMKKYLGDKKFIVLDEAQKIENIGTVLKLLIDNYPDMQIVATGSSSFELANKINEPLTGRNFKLFMYPLSVAELIENYDKLTVQRILSHLLIFGTYPEILEGGPEREIKLQTITVDYLYTDLLSYHGIKKPQILEKILRALALQVGNQVSHFEIAQKIGVDSQTVSSYIDILEKAFIVFRLRPLTSRQRDEIKLMHKVYFWDNGILNALRGNLKAEEFRDDMGVLFENFFISEKMKLQKYSHQYFNNYFWRTKKGEEVDFIEEKILGKEYEAYECKYDRDTLRMPSLFMETYKPIKTNLVNRYNLLDFFSGGPTSGDTSGDKT